MPPRDSSQSPLLSLHLLILLLSIITFLLFFIFFFTVPNTHHNNIINNNKLRSPPPLPVKKSWPDSLSTFLVLFAILCGIFARRNTDDPPSSGDDGIGNIDTNVGRNIKDAENSHVSNHDWFDNRNQFASPSMPVRRLKRNSSSYPDLRQESLWQSDDDDDVNRFRFFDDFEISKFRSSDYSNNNNNNNRRQRSGYVFDQDSPIVKEIPVDTYVINRSSTPTPPPMSPAPPPPPPPPPLVSRNHHRQRSHRTVSREKNEGEVQNPPPPPPPPPPPSAPPVTKKLERKKSNATKEIKMALISFYHQSKRKKKQKTRNFYNEHSHSQPHSFTVPPPSPPPPPPPSFHNFFKKSGKSKRIHSFSTPPPPPPPPPRQDTLSKRSSKRKTAPPPPPPPAPQTHPRAPIRRERYTPTGRPPLPTRVSSFEENIYSGGQSPVIPMPPPPPPPPFKVPGFKFMVRGDYVKIRSAHSSRCSSPELEEVNRQSTDRVNATEGGSVLCPSPDVNYKADSFIARLRGEWRMEKINSVKNRSMGLGPDSSPSSI